MMANGGKSTLKTWAPAAIAIGLIMFVVPLWIHFPLLDPDEGLHAGIAQEMVERGDWVTPRFLGEPFLDKPILYFWAEALSLKLFGFNEVAVRLSGLLFGLLGAITTGLLAWRLLGASTGWIAGILYATTILPTALAQAASHDVALIPWINLALLFLWESQRGYNRNELFSCRRRLPSPIADESATPSATGVASYNHASNKQFRPLYSWPCILGAGFFVGLLILTKGLSGVAVVGIAYGGYRLVSRRVDLNLVLQGVVVIQVAVLVAAPWYAALEMQNPGYLHYYFIDRHVLGVATASQPHGDQPWWYYFPLLLGGGLPWIGYLPTLLRKRGEKTPNELAATQHPAQVPGLNTSPVPFLWCWLIGWVIFLTLAQSKLATYLWPAFPAVAILAAVAWSRLFEKSLGEAARRAFARTFVWSSWSGPIVLPTAVFVVQMLLNERFPWSVWVATAVVAAAAPLPLIPWRAGRPRTALIAAAFSMAAQFMIVMTLILPQAAERYTARDLAEHFNNRQRFPERLFVVEERIGSLVFYLNSDLRADLSLDRLSRLSLDEPIELAPGDAIAIPKEKLQKAIDSLGLEDTSFEPAGRYRIYTVGQVPRT